MIKILFYAHTIRIHGEIHCLSLRIHKDSLSIFMASYQHIFFNEIVYFILVIRILPIFHQLLNIRNMLIIRNICTALISTLKISDKEFIFIRLLQRKNFSEEMFTVLKNIIIYKCNIIGVINILWRKKYIWKVWSILITSPHKAVIICATVTLTIWCNESSCRCFYKLSRKHIRATTLFWKCGSNRRIHVVQFN